MAGTITSPNYPSNYPNNSNIWYYINVDIPHFRIKVTFDNGFRLDSNCKKDNVTIYDGETTSFPVLGNRDGYCGSSPPPALGSTKNKMLIVFRTDENISFSGFSLKYSRGMFLSDSFCFAFGAS